MPNAMMNTTRDDQRQRYIRKVAETLKYARRKAGLSSRELASRVGSSHSTILCYEAGRKTPTVITFLRLLHACGFSVDFLLSPRMRGGPDHPKGEELEAVLDLAAEFPAKHSKTPDNAPLPSRRSHG